MSKLGKHKARAGKLVNEAFDNMLNVCNGRWTTLYIRTYNPQKWHSIGLFCRKCHVVKILEQKNN